MSTANCQHSSIVYDVRRGCSCTICGMTWGAPVPAPPPGGAPDTFIVARALSRIIVELDDVNGWLPTSLQAQGEVYETAREVLRAIDMEPERPAAAPPVPPGHTDLMVSPESLDAYLAENPPAPAPGEDASPARTLTVKRLDSEASDAYDAEVWDEHALVASVRVYDDAEQIAALLSRVPPKPYPELAAPSRSGAPATLVSVARWIVEHRPADAADRLAVALRAVDAAAPSSLGDARGARALSEIEDVLREIRGGAGDAAWVRGRAEVGLAAVLRMKTNNATREG